jgi:uncharacterized membrane protein (DUF4010 family)
VFVVDGGSIGVMRIAVAALGGAAIGVERQWSGHATGPGARIGGVRTYTLFGALAGIAGWIWSLGLPALAAVLLAGAAGLVVAAYVAASRHDVDGTTEVAGLIVLAAGVLAGQGYLALSSGIIALTCLILVEKTSVHTAVSKLDDAEVRAGVRFAVMAAVVLPLLPEGPFGPLGGIRPRQLWLLVLFFSGLSFAGFIARRAVGASRGYALAGLLGGMVSSTSVTFNFSRGSRAHPDLGRPLAIGILAACTVLFPRVLLATAVLNADLLTALLPYVVAPFLVGLLVTAMGWRKLGSKEGTVQESSNPLELRTALQLAALFQVVLFVVHIAQTHWGNLGIVVSGAVIGLTDMDALTISMAHTASDPALVLPAAQAVAMGILSNTLFKLATAAALGRSSVRTMVPVGLAIMAAASIASLYLLR